MFEKRGLKQVYLRIFFILSVALTIAVMCFTFFTAQLFSSFALDEIDAYTKQRIEQMAMNTEFNLNRLKLYGLRIYEDEAIRNWMVALEDHPKLQAKASISMGNYLTTEPLIHSIYLINQSTEKVMTSLEGIYKMTDFYDQALLSKLNKNQLLRFENHMSNGQPLLTLIIPASRTKQEFQGYVVMHLNKSVMERYIMNINDSYTNELLIVNGDGAPILGNDKLIEGIQIDDHSSSDHGRFEWSKEDEKWSVRYVRIKGENWTLYHFMQMDLWKMKRDNLQSNIIYISILFLITLVIIFYWISRKHYKPFGELVRNLQRQIGSEHQNEKDHNHEAHEAVYIQTSIDALLSKYNHLDETMKRNKHLLKEEFLRQWILTGKVNVPLQRFLETETVFMENDALAMGVLRIEHYSEFSEAHEFSTRKLLKYAMGNIAQEVFKKYGFTTEIIDLGNDHIVLLIPLKHLEATIESVMMEEVRNEITHWLKIKCTAAISEEKSLDENLHYLHNEIYELSMLKFISGEERIYREVDLELHTECVQPFNEELVMQLIKSVQLRNEIAVTSYIHSLIEKLQGLPYKECKHQLIYIYFSVMKSFKPLQIMQSFEGIQEELDRYETLTEAMQALQHKLEEIIKEDRQGNEQRSVGRKEELVSEIIEYVLNHLQDPMLSVEEVATQVSLSTNYVRQIFKETSTISLSDFIIQCRVEMVRKLLQTTNWTVAEIVEHSGFQTRSHFFTVFKKVTGKTPNQYRQELNHE